MAEPTFAIAADAMASIPKDARKNLRRELRKAAGPLLREIRSNASWSTRIPRATRISTRFSRRNPGVTIRTSARSAPHARPYENLGRPGTFRHMVFGHRDRWVTEPARPFFFPAVQRHRGNVRKATLTAIQDAARQNGYT